MAAAAPPIPPRDSRSGAAPAVPPFGEGAPRVPDPKSRASDTRDGEAPSGSIKWKVGMECEAQWEDGHWYYAHVEALASEGNNVYAVLFPDFGETYNVKPSQLRGIPRLPSMEAVVDEHYYIPDVDMVRRRTVQLLEEQKGQQSPGLKEGLNSFEEAGGVLPPFHVESLRRQKERKDKKVEFKDIPHLFTLCHQEQAKAIQVLRSLASLLKKTSDLQIRAADEMLKLTSAAGANRTQVLLEGDFKSLSEGVFFIEGYLGDLHNSQRKFATEVTDMITVKIVEFCDEADKERLNMLANEEAVANFVKAQTLELSRLHTSAIKAWHSLCSISKKSEEDGAAKNERKLEGAMKNAQRRFEKFEEQRGTVLAYQAEYLDKFKILWEQMEQMTRDRVAFTKQKLCLFSKLEKTYFQHPNHAKVLQKHFQDLVAGDQVDEFVQEVHTRHGSDPLYRIPSYFSLPCDNQQLIDGSWKLTNEYIATTITADGDDVGSESSHTAQSVKGVQHSESEPSGLAEELSSSGDRKKASGHRRNNSHSARTASLSVKNFTAGVASSGKGQKASVVGNFMRGLVSKKKKRFQKDGYDLDLTYVNTQIIAMGFPAEKLAGMYRNPMSEVQRFFDDKHADVYKVYNLCSELEYDHAKFHNRVARYPFNDHNPSQFNLIQPFCEDVLQWLTKGPQYLAAIHCKAGKGRTGYLISCYLMHCLDQPTAQDALDHYASQRTHNRKGVTIPSQIRFVHYYDRFLKDRKRVSEGLAAEIPAERTVWLKRLIMHEMPFDFIKNPDSISFTASKQLEGGKLVPVEVEWSPVFNSAKNYMIFGLPTTKETKGLASLDADILFSFRSTNCKCHFWFNTRFLIEDTPGSKTFSLVIPKDKVDKARKDKANEHFPSDFVMEAIFEEIESSPA